MRLAELQRHERCEVICPVDWIWMVKMVFFVTMGKRILGKTMSDLLREDISAAPSIREVAREVGLTHVSLVRFVNGKQSLRLDLADKLAGYFRIECVRRKDR